MSISQNKLTPLLVVAAALIVGYVLYVKFTASAKPVSSGTAMSAPPMPGTSASAVEKSSSVFGGSSLPATRGGDADNTAETLATVVASNKELRAVTQQLLEDNAQLRQRFGGMAGPVNEEAIAGRVRAQVLSEQRRDAPAQSQATPQAQAGGSNAVGNILEGGLDAATRMLNSIGTQPGSQGRTATARLPSAVDPGTAATPAAGGQVYGQSNGQSNDSSGASGNNAAGAAVGAAAPGAAPQDGQPVAQGPALPAAGAPLSRVVAPMGYRARTPNDQGGPNETGLIRTSLAAVKERTVAAAPLAAPAQPSKPELIPYFTIPENATLGRSVAMTTLVGRVPVDGRVQDPMQFKLVIGRNNLAASGQFVPDDIAGAIISGIAVGDMGLSCTEGLIQSITFVFDDGTIRTVSQRRDGATQGFGSGGGAAGGSGVGGQSLASASKLGWISDEFGNPCIPGEFKTNAPQYLADVIGIKGLSAVGSAIAAAQTTTVSGSSAVGSTTSSTVTGDTKKYVLGNVASSGASEVVGWLTKRMNNSFDAVVVRAGTRVAVHIDQAIAIDKDPEGRRLDYGRTRTSFAEQQGVRHGID